MSTAVGGWQGVGWFRNGAVAGEHLLANTVTKLIGSVLLK